MIKDGSLVLFYVKDQKLYPIAMTESEFNLLQLLGKTFEPIKVINKPQGNVVDLKEVK